MLQTAAGVLRGLNWSADQLKAFMDKTAEYMQKRGKTESRVNTQAAAARNLTCNRLKCQAEHSQNHINITLGIWPYMQL